MLKTHPAKTLGAVLASLFNKEQIIEMLGITEEKDDEFWLTQKFAVVDRFYSYILHSQNLPLTLARETLPAETAALLILYAKEFIAQGITYETVRNWWLHEGSYLHNRQFDAKREAEDLSHKGIAALFFFEGSRPLWLAFDANKQPVLTQEETEAHLFPIYSPTDLNKEKLTGHARDFDKLRKTFNAVNVKLLPRYKPAYQFD